MWAQSQQTAWYIEVSAANSDDLHLIPRTHKEEGENRHRQIDLCPPKGATTREAMWTQF